MNRDWGVGRSDFAAFIEYARALVGRESKGMLLGVGTLATPFAPPLLLANAQQLGHPQVSDREWWSRASSRVQPLTDMLREQLGMYDAPPQTMVMAVEPPEPMGRIDKLLATTGRAIRAEMRGTLGPVVKTRAGIRHLTAGHVAGRVGMPVHLIAKRGLGPTRFPRIGTVEFSTDATFGRPEYDVGVVACDSPRGTPCKVARVGQHQPAPLNGTLTGGVSGRRFGLIIGSLAAYSDADGRYAWTNSWILTPGEIGAEGDSGGAVALDNGEILGILVGGSRVTGSRNFAHLYVQDLECIERDVLDARNPEA
ncbi:MAG TPA: hypothetical protein VIJ50_14235 [Solirubrobacteraceae bacterium]